MVQFLFTTFNGTITPIGNALIRIGSLEEKELVFRAFIEQDEYFEYKKRATKIHLLRRFRNLFMIELLCCVKMQNQRQDKMRNKGFDEVSNH